MRPPSLAADHGSGKLWRGLAKARLSAEREGGEPQTRSRELTRAGIFCPLASSAARSYLIATMNTSAGFPPVFFDSCFWPRPMNMASPVFQLVFVFPSTFSESEAGASAMTT